MPIYEYRCGKCGHTMERIQKLGDPPLSDCPACGGRLEKLISSVAVQFKGGGWYADGYSGKGGTKDGGTKDGGSEAGGDGPPKDGAKTPPKKAAAGGCGSGSCGCH